MGLRRLWKQSSISANGYSRREEHRITCAIEISRTAKVVSSELLSRGKPSGITSIRSRGITRSSSLETLSRLHSGWTGPVCGCRGLQTAWTAFMVAFLIAAWPLVWWKISNESSTPLATHGTQFQSFRTMKSHLKSSCSTRRSTSQLDNWPFRKTSCRSIRNPGRMVGTQRVIDGGLDPIFTFVFGETPTSLGPWKPCGSFAGDGKLSSYKNNQI